MKVLLTCFFLLVCGNRVFADSAELRQQILEKAELVTAWHIDYDVVSPVMKPGDKVIHRSVALRSPDSLLHWTGNVPYQSTRTWKDDILQQRTIVSGLRCHWDFPMRRASKEWACDSKSLFPGSLRSELLWDVLIWWPFTTDSNHLLSSESYTVEDVLRDDDYQILDSTEQVGDRPCYVLSCDGKGSLWFDCSEPSIMRKREWYQRAENSIWRAELFDHQQVESGVFCPRKITWTEMRKDSTQGSKETIKEFSVQIVAAAFNESVTPDLFRFPEPLPGHVESNDDGYIQVRPGANDYAESILHWTRGVAARPVQAKEISRTELAFHVGLYGFATWLLVTGAKGWWTSRKPAIEENRHE
jgi:hypothetical protein